MAKALSLSIRRAYCASDVWFLVHSIFGAGVVGDQTISMGRSRDVSLRLVVVRHGSVAVAWISSSLVLLNYGKPEKHPKHGLGVSAASTRKTGRECHDWGAGRLCMSRFCVSMKARLASTLSRFPVKGPHKRRPIPLESEHFWGEPRLIKGGIGSCSACELWALEQEVRI